MFTSVQNWLRNNWAISDGPSGTSPGQITDGAANTLMVIERKHSGINWLDPVCGGAQETRVKH